MAQNPTPIICDINIWYRLSDGRIAPDQVKNLHLVGTFVNGYEFCCSQYALSDYQKLRAAIIAYNQYANVYRGEIPEEHMRMVSNHKSTMSRWAEVKRQIDFVAKTENVAVSDLAQLKYKEHADQIIQASEPFAEMITEHRSKIGVRGIHKRKMDLPENRLKHKEITKQVLTNLVGGISLDWVRLELFLNTFDEWIRQLSIQDSLKMKPSDWNDLSNLVYVQPGSLYWTEDYKKTREFIENSGCGHYLYQPDSQS